MRQLLREWHWQRLNTQLAQLKLLVLDVDGVLTDGGLWFDQRASLQKRFNVRDRHGLRLLQQEGSNWLF